MMEQRRTLHDIGNIGPLDIQTSEGALYLLRHKGVAGHGKHDHHGQGLLVKFVEKRLQDDRSHGL